MRYLPLTLFFLYLISCTSNDTSRDSYLSAGQALMTSLGAKHNNEAVRSFSQFVQNISGQPMIAASEVDLQNEALQYFPDSTVSKGYDLHVQELGNLDAHLLLFYEYFDLYENWSKTYLGLFSPEGHAEQVNKLWDISFEGSTSINIIDQKILEVIYYDFFTESDLNQRAIIPADHLYLEAYEARNDKTEGYIYEYYQLGSNGLLEPLSQTQQISINRVFPQASARLFALEEMLRYPNESLQLMANEIYAHHGYRFSDAATRQYFEEQDWYFAQHDNVDTLLSDVERINLEKIRRIEAEEY